MSDTGFDSDPAEDSDDILAAEYVLAVLPAAEQAMLERRVSQDLAFARLVAGWEERLSPLAEGFTPENLPPGVKRALDLHLFGRGAAGQGFWSRLPVWRGLAGASLLALLLALSQPLLQSLAPQQRLAASLMAEGSNVTYLVVYDAARGNVSLAPLSGDAVEGRDFELWVARGSEAPVSLGVIPPARATHVEISAQIRDLMTTAAHMAISLEPPGGSPTGQPTGPVLAVGDLLEI